MAGKNRVGGICYIKVNGILYSGKGDFDYSVLKTKKEGVVGSSGVAGYKETAQVPYIEGKLTDSIDLDVKSLQESDDATVTLELANGKVVALYQAWYAGEGKGNSGEGELDFRFEGIDGEEVVA